MSNEHVHPTFQDCLRALAPEPEPNRDEIREWLEVSMAILTCEDVAKLRRVIHLAEGRIIEIENCSLRGELSNEGREAIGGVDPEG